jgi:hypothetical protein
LDGPLFFTQGEQLVYHAKFKKGELQTEKKFTIEKADTLIMINMLGKFSYEDFYVNPCFTLLKDGDFTYSGIVGCDKTVKGKGIWRIEGKVLQLKNPMLNLPGDLSFTNKDYCLYGKKLYPNINGSINPSRSHFVFKKNKN